jgi:hypothetical protein
MHRRTLLTLTAALSLTAGIAAIAACAEAPPTDLIVDQAPADPEPTAEAPKPLPPSNPPKVEDAGSKDSGEKKDAAPPPPPPPKGVDGEMCDPDDPMYQQSFAGGSTGDCPCLAGECCYEMRIGSPPFQLVLASGCVEK